MNNEQMLNCRPIEIQQKLQRIIDAYLNKSESEYYNELTDCKCMNDILIICQQIITDLEPSKNHHYRSGNEKEKIIVRNSMSSSRNLDENFEDYPSITDGQLNLDEDTSSITGRFLAESSAMDPAKETPANLGRFLEESKYLKPYKSLDEIKEENQKQKYKWIRNSLPTDFKKWELLNPNVCDFECAILSAGPIMINETDAISAFLGEVFDQYKDKTLNTLIKQLQENKSICIDDAEIREELIDKLKQSNINKFKIIDNQISL